MIGIYKLTNQVNGKIYIGQSTNLGNRLAVHKCKQKGTNRLLDKAFQEFGFESFSIDILISTKSPISKEELDNLETYFINYFNSCDESIGYNVTNGGQSLSEEDREKLSISMKKYWNGLSFSDYSNRVNINKLSHNSEEYILRLSSIIKSHWERDPMRKIALSKKVSGANNPAAKKVICVETGKVFNTIKDAHNAIGKKGISEVLHGRSKTCAGYHWAYL